MPVSNVYRSEISDCIAGMAAHFYCTVEVNISSWRITEEYEFKVKYQMNCVFSCQRAFIGLSAFKIIF